jgi:SAM-dependent methyltransferase
MPRRRSNNHRPRRTSRLTARTADRHDLYQRSVQGADYDIDFICRHFKKLTGKPLRRLREDFCCTALLASTFVRRHRENRAWGIDLDAPTLAWARRHNLEGFTPEQNERLRLVQADVSAVKRPRVETVFAFNFSYCVFKARPELGRYFRAVYDSLLPSGVFLIDVYGGADSQLEQRDTPRRLGGFAYVWEQASFDPISNHIQCKIHFRFPDGSRLRNAFVYDWRLWTLPELIELMTEAGFDDVHVLWEATDRQTGEGNGTYRRAARGDADPAWVAYVSGQRPG